MEIRLHKNATTTPALRKAIQNSNLSERKLAQKFYRAPVRCLNGSPEPLSESGKPVEHL